MKQRDLRRLAADMFYPVSVAAPTAMLGILLLTLDGGTAQPAFFDAASQIVAVLLIALILEVRVLTRPTGIRLPEGSHRWAIITSLYVLVMLCVAEYQCLRALAVDKPASSRLVVIALLSGGLALLLSSAARLSAAQR